LPGERLCAFDIGSARVGHSFEHATPERTSQIALRLHLVAWISQWMQ
jgi:hypothetical protein